MTETVDPEYRTIWQYDLREERRGTKGWGEVLAFARANGVPEGRVLVPGSLTVVETTLGQRELRAWIMDEGCPLCPNCQGCVTGRNGSFPVTTDLPEAGWHDGHPPSRHHAEDDLHAARKLAADLAKKAARRVREAEEALDVAVDSDGRL